MSKNRVFGEVAPDTCRKTEMLIYFGCLYEWMQFDYLVRLTRGSCTSFLHPSGLAGK